LSIKVSTRLLARARNADPQTSTRMNTLLLIGGGVVSLDWLSAPKIQRHRRRWLAARRCAAHRQVALQLPTDSSLNAAFEQLTRDSP
jgi:hypothetical protein